jgi:3-oxoacyl-[acyl-carrier protein] reductase
VDLGLRGKVALITGGSRGIGRMTALRLAEEGCDVAICARNAAGVERTAEELRAFGGRVHGIAADVTAAGEVERFVQESAAALGGVDLLVANVGGSAGGELLDSTPEDWLRTFDLNLFHAVRAIRAAVPHMQTRGGGSAVVISSISGWKTGPRTQYGSAKAAEIFLSSGLAWELGTQRIRVNTVSPGSTLFPGGGWDRTRSQDPERFRAFAQREFPWSRLGTPEEIADVIVFFATDDARYVTGQELLVDGGLTINGNVGHARD